MQALIERLSDHVHQAWMAEKLKQGFADHPRTIADDGTGCCVAEKHHTDMLPYAELPENVKEYDRVTVRAVLSAIEAEGYAVLRHPRSLRTPADREDDRGEGAM